ncbi:MAG: prepilin-type N-terminal cleavage/methylation domain-containing protein [Sandaracinaceae bacterium]|nr:prepilin-type N-terminal cleavage/methylation domain-containing protein [Sandaracinaceae bacterium]MBP7680932.1 prepilin-type N-terminal cleavage/methylation domain-containing protein [Deltaproteobacteria bacterium]
MTSRRPTPAERRTDAGFTLVEMLVAVVAGAMTIATVYSLGAGSNRAFQEQNRIAQAQAAVRSAMENVRRDISRAGFGGTPDSGTNASNGDRGANPAGCAVTQGFRLVGLDVNHDAYTAQLRLPGDTVNRVQADGIVMSGNYATGDHYLVAEIVGGTTISLQQTRQSFRRSFGSPLDAQRFEDAFRAGRWVYLVSETGRRAAREITSVNGASATITVTPGISVGCFGYGRGARISPISRVEYYATAPENDAAFAWLLPAGTAAERDARGVDQTILARRELTFSDANTPIANSERVVLEYLVHFDAAVTRATAAAGAVDPGLVETLSGDGGAAALAGAPGSGRALRVTLGVRTPGVDRNFPWAGPRASQRASLRSYLPRLPPNTSATQAVGQAPAAHVRTAEEVIMLENIANRGLR